MSTAMTIRDISTYLQRFDPPPEAPLEAAPVEDAPFEGSFDEHEEIIPPPLAQVEIIDPDAIRRELETEFMEKLRVERESHEQSLQNAREQWTEQEAAVLARRLTEDLQAAFESLREDVARILAPFVSREIQAKTLDELTAAIRRAIQDESAPAITVSGPKDLTTKISIALASESAPVNLVESDTIDVSVELPKMKIETRLGAWMRSLSEGRKETQ